MCEHHFDLQPLNSKANSRDPFHPGRLERFQYRAPKKSTSFVAANEGQSFGGLWFRPLSKGLLRGTKWFSTDPDTPDVGKIAAMRKRRRRRKSGFVMQEWRLFNPPEARRRMPDVSMTLSPIRDPAGDRGHFDHPARHLAG